MPTETPPSASGTFTTTIIDMPANRSGSQEYTIESTVETSPRISAPSDIRNYLPDIKIYTPESRQSNEGDYQLCQRYYLLRHRCGLVRKGHVSVPATRGQIFHLAMKYHWLGLPWEQILSLVSIFVSELKENIAAQLPDQGARLLDLCNAIDSNVPTALAMAAYAAEVARLPQGVEPLAVEQPLKLALKNPDANNSQEHRPVGIYAGTPDLLLLDAQGILLADAPGYWIVDYKTVGRTKLNDYARKMPFAFQLRLYRLLTEAYIAQQAPANWPKLPVRGVYYLLLRTPQIRLSGNDRDCQLVEKVLTRDSSKGSKGEVITEKVYTGEPKFENYLTRLGRWYRADGEYAQCAEDRRFDPYIKVHSMPFAEDLWPEDFTQRMWRIGLASRALPVLRTFPTNDRACNNFYGGNCPMLDICETPPTSWASIVADKYFQQDITTYVDALDREDTTEEPNDV